MTESHKPESHFSERFSRLRRALSIKGMKAAREQQTHEKFQREGMERLDTLLTQANGLNKEAVQIIQAYDAMPHGPSRYPRHGVQIIDPRKTHTERQWTMPMVFGTPADRTRYRYEEYHMPIDMAEVPTIEIDEVTIPIHVLTVNVFADYNEDDVLVGHPRTELHINPILRDPDHPHKGMDNNDLLSGQVSIEIADSGAIRQLLVGRNYTTSVGGHDKAGLRSLDSAMSTILKGVRHKAFEFSNESLEAELRGLEEDQ